MRVKVKRCIVGKRYYDKVHLQNSSSGYSPSLFPQLCQELGALCSGKDYPQGKALWTLTFDNFNDVGTAIETSDSDVDNPTYKEFPVRFYCLILKDHRGSPHIWGKLKSSAPVSGKEIQRKRKEHRGQKIQGKNLCQICGKRILFISYIPETRTGSYFFSLWNNIITGKNLKIKLVVTKF